jgi:predicted ATPase
MPNNRMKLKNLNLKGFKSIDSEGQSIEFGDITVFLGANGSGKSNLVSFFKLLNYLTAGGLQIFIGQQGFANSLLYYGSSTTPRIRAELSFEQAGAGKETYSFTLSHASGDTLIFTEEYVGWEHPGSQGPKKVDLGAGHKETKLLEDRKAEAVGPIILFMLGRLNLCQVYHFHDTSSTAGIRNQGYTGDNQYLQGNAGNLAAFLFAMANNEEGKKHYERIVRHIQLVMPQFGDFVLRPSPENKDYIRLDWREKKRKDYIFGPHLLSDGSLRFMALATLLLQPAVAFHPKVIILDEPELGLHPAAIASLAGMIRAASMKSQIIVATQSPRLVDEFNIDEIVIVERDEAKDRSLFKRLDEKDLSEWLERYSLSDLWEKNVLGGRP